MHIFIKSCLSGAQNARGLVVIIDVISASSTIVNLFEASVKTVIPVNSMKKAKELKKQHKDSLICAEMRHRIRGIDLLNSPRITKEVVGKTIIMKTNAGTKGLLGAKKADKIVVGCFLNSQAIVEYIKKLKPNEVSLVPMGNSGKTPNTEDEACAVYLKELLQNKEVNFEKAKEKIIKGSLKNLLRSVITPENMDSVLQLNTSKIVPELVDGRIVAK